MNNVRFHARSAEGAAFHTRDDDPIDRLTQAFEAHSSAISESFAALDRRFEAAGNTVIPAVSRRSGVVPEPGQEPHRSPVGMPAVTLGEQFAEHLKRSENKDALGGKSGRLRVEVRAATITTAPASAGALISPDRDQTITMQPRRRLIVRALLGRGETASTSVEFMRQTGFTNAAKPVAEGEKKPQSEIAFELREAKVRTIPHFVKASRQVLEDAPLLRSTIDGELRYGLDEEEEDQLLNGDGQGQNLLGLIRQATAYDITRNKTGDTRFDTLLHAIEQCELAKLPASGVILHASDWFAMLGTKDADGNYISGGPLANVPERVWRMPVAWTTAIQEGDFLVGAFDTAATIWDRQTTIVEAGYENDDFTRNLVTILAEKRLAMGVRRPEAIVKGTFPQAPSRSI